MGQRGAAWVRRGVNESVACRGTLPCITPRDESGSLGDRVDSEGLRKAVMDPDDQEELQRQQSLITSMEASFAKLQASMEQLAAMRLHTICVTRYQRRTAPLESTAEWEAELEPVPFSLGLA